MNNRSLTSATSSTQHVSYISTASRCRSDFSIHSSIFYVLRSAVMQWWRRQNSLAVSCRRPPHVKTINKRLASPVHVLAMMPLHCMLVTIISDSLIIALHSTQQPVMHDVRSVNTISNRCSLSTLSLLSSAQNSKQMNNSTLSQALYTHSVQYSVMVSVATSSQLWAVCII